MFKYLLPVALFLVLVGFLFVGLYRDPSELPSPLIGKPVPQFSLPRLNDANTFTDKEFLGKVSLLNVWATWCFACHQEHPVLNKLAGKKVAPIYGLNYKDDASEASQYLNNYGNPYTANAFDESGRVGIDWGVYGAPETFLIDRKGIIRYKHIGPLTQEDVEKIILPMIQQLKDEKSNPHVAPDRL